MKISEPAARVVMQPMLREACVRTLTRGGRLLVDPTPNSAYHTAKDVAIAALSDLSRAAYVVIN